VITPGPKGRQGFSDFSGLEALQAHKTKKNKYKGNKRMTGVDEDFLGELQKANVSGRGAATGLKQRWDDVYARPRGGKDGGVWGSCKVKYRSALL
jgi:hypothetical protein